MGKTKESNHQHQSQTLWIQRDTKKTLPTYYRRMQPAQNRTHPNKNNQKYQ